MNKSRASKTKAAGLMIGQTKHSKPYGLMNRPALAAMNRMMRRAQGK